MLDSSLLAAIAANRASAIDEMRERAYIHGNHLGPAPIRQNKPANRAFMSRAARRRQPLDAALRHYLRPGTSPRRIAKKIGELA
jgi:hypothetical protein